MKDSNSKPTELPCSRTLIFLTLALTLLFLVPLYLHHWPASSEIYSAIDYSCDLFSGRWVPYNLGPYYTNETNCVIDDRQNCMKFGRPDTGFINWRWRPDECELPRFDPIRFLRLLRGKTLAFVGDSVGRNQMQSLVCLLASAAIPVDVSYVDDTKFRRWLYKDYNFTIVALWSPFLVRAREGDPSGYSFNSMMNLYLDQPDGSWAAQIQDVDIVIISSGQWFFRPFIYHQNGRIVGCNECYNKNISELTRYYGYRMAFRTAFRTLLRSKQFKGLTILRTFSPAHFENGQWNTGGSCKRTKPFTREETQLEDFNMEFYFTQMEELRTAEREARKRGWLRFTALDTTQAMAMRPDGHPNHYGHSLEANVTVADCVHWCMPGAVDTWNELLLEVLREFGGGMTKKRQSFGNMLN